MSNLYCEVLGIDVPKLEDVMGKSGVGFYALMFVVLLERGGPVTLLEVAQRFEEAGRCSVEKALASLKRCRPGTAPIYRDGEEYSLDPHDREADFLSFRLGLSGPKVQRKSVESQESKPLPSVEDPLTIAYLEEAWRNGIPNSTSAQRLALCILDAHGEAMPGSAVVAFAAAQGGWGLLSLDSAKYWRKGAAIRVAEDGYWHIVVGHDALRSARQAVRSQVESARKRPMMDPVELIEWRLRAQAEADAEAKALSCMSRVIVHGFPTDNPQVLTLLDVGEHEIKTYTKDTIAEGAKRLADYDIIAGVDVRKLMRVLKFDASAKRLGELGPPQKTMSLNRQGRTLKITLDLIVSGTCGLSRPFGAKKTMMGYLKENKATKLRRRMESDVKALYALYQYGRLHGCSRLRWGFLDELLNAPWAAVHDGRLNRIGQQAFQVNAPLEVVVGNAPGWEDPWARGQIVTVELDGHGWPFLLDHRGNLIDNLDVQAARIPPGC